MTPAPGLARSAAGGSAGASSRPVPGIVGCAAQATDRTAKSGKASEEWTKRTAVFVMEKVSSRVETTASRAVSTWWRAIFRKEAERWRERYHMEWSGTTRGESPSSAWKYLYNAPLNFATHIISGLNTEFFHRFSFFSY